MNLYDSSNMVGLDMAALVAATDRPRVLFVTNDVLGWRTFGSELARATEERDDLYAVHLRFSDDRGTLRRIAERRMWRGQELRHAHGALVRSWSTKLRAMLGQPPSINLFDAVHVSPHLLALGIVNSNWNGPLSVIFDSDVKRAKGQRQLLTPSQFERDFQSLCSNEALIMRRANRLWAMSTWAATNMADEYGLDADTISIVPPVRAVSSRSWDDVETEGRRVRIAFVGNDIARKGGYRLLRWHQDRWIGRAELHVFTAHKPPKGELTDVVWHQRVDNRALVTEYLKSMDFFVLPTASDMSPFAVSEAVAAGLPVVSSAIGGIGELVQDDVTGYLLEPSDDHAFIMAIERLFDPELRRQMGRAALASAETSLNADIVMSKFVDGILDLVH